MIKTYLWIIATAYSRQIKIIKMKEVEKKYIGIFSLISLKRESKRCPAIILAANRTDKVIGRIIFLVVSMNTIKTLNKRGVPLGIKCENILLVKLIQPNSINVNQRGRAKFKVIERCLVLVKI